MASTQQELSKIYHRRFVRTAAYRNRVWQVLTQKFFKQWVEQNAIVLDLGCGYGEFINNIEASRKYAMDLNPDAPAHLAKNIEFLHQDCSAPWPMPDNTLDVVFTSNFFEHLPDKATLGRTLDEIRRCLKPGGRLVAMGPNIKYVPGTYWDFWDHYVILTELSLREALETRGFRIDICLGKFLPYTIVGGPRYPLAFLRAYLRLPLAWRVFGRQFLVVGVRAALF